MAKVVELTPRSGGGRKDPAHIAAYEALKQALKTGAFTPGQKITIMATAKALGMSTTPVREALKRLVSDGALEMLPNRSVRLPALTLERLHELTKMRAALEGLAAQEAARNASDKEIARLEAIQIEMLAARDRGDVAERLRCNEAFHFTLYRAARMPRLMRTLDSLWMESGPYFNLLKPTTDGIGYTDGLTYHASAITAIRQGNCEAARAAIVLDIESAADALVAQLRAGNSMETIRRERRK